MAFAAGRRDFLKLIALTGCATVCSGALAQATAPLPLQERLAAAASRARLALRRAGQGYGGQGWNMLVAQARQSRFILFGEEHGLAAVPPLVSALYAQARADRLAAEVSPPIALDLEQVLDRGGGYQAAANHLASASNWVPFFSLAEETRMLAAMHAASGRSERPFIWGLDIEVGADRRLVERLRELRKPASAERQLALFVEAQRAARARMAAQRDPRSWFLASADPALLRELRRSWPTPPAEAAMIMNVLQESIEINALFLARRGWESNARRAAVNRRNLLAHLPERNPDGSVPRVLFKFGSNHLLRGLNYTDVFDIGTLAVEAAAIERRGVTSVVAIGGRSSRKAVYDPVSDTYQDRGADGFAETGLGFLAAASEEGELSMFDLRPLRPILSGFAARAENPFAAKTVHSYDFVIVVNGSAPGSPLRTVSGSPA